MNTTPRRWAPAVLAWLLVGVASAASGAWIDGWRSANPVWRGVHLLVQGNARLKELESVVPALAQAGVNVVVVEVNYAFAFDSHPELRMGGAGVVGKEDAARLVRVCRANGVRLIPQFSSLGHQSWAKTTYPLLTRYPELDETPGQHPGNEGIYCRSWCPQHPRLASIVFPLLDELINAFEADAMHVGMDEVFLLASEHCPRCRGGNPAELFARAVNDLHAQLAGRRGLEVLMWADRLLDAASTGYGEWEAAKNGTAPAVDRIPKDVILCDWHYEPLSKYAGRPKDYGSVPFLLGKGFRVWPSGWKQVEAVEAFLDSARAHRTDRLLGYLVTTWGAVPPKGLPDWEPLKVGIGKVRGWE